MRKSTHPVALDCRVGFNYKPVSDQMKIFTKPMDDPQVIAMLKKGGFTLLEVTVKQFYLIEGNPGPLPPLIHEWFVKYKSSAHAFRDSCLIRGADQVQQVHNLTNDREVLAACSAKDERTLMVLGVD